VPLPKSSREFLLHLATNVDELSRSLAMKTCLAADIGLSSTQPMSGYPTITTDQKYFFYPFMSAIALDHCLWSCYIRVHIRGSRRDPIQDESRLSRIIGPEPHPRPSRRFPCIRQPDLDVRLRISGPSDIH
jgi:hypothetical protein